MERDEGLIETIKSSESVREGWLQAFSKQISDEDLKWGAGIVWYDHERFALRSFFIEDSLTEAKQHFYTCGRLDEHLIDLYNGRILEYGISNISYALLSDHQGLIRRYADLGHPGYDKIIKRGSIIYAMQLAIKDELGHEYVDVLDALSQKKGQTAIQPDVSFLGL